MLIGSNVNPVSTVTNNLTDFQPIGVLQLQSEYLRLEAVRFLHGNGVVWGGTFSINSQIKVMSFSYCLVDHDLSVSSTLDFNSGLLADLVVAPLMKSGKIDMFYFVGLTGFSIGGQQIQLSLSLVDINDSGVHRGRDAFVKQTKDLSSMRGVALFDTCYDLSSRSSVKVPRVSFYFGGGKLLDLPAKSYLIPLDFTGAFCFAFALTSSSMSIIGPRNALFWARNCCLISPICPTKSN
ncbi:Protein ASPARTIC PROTEASE IN GUARD CELL 1 [Hibiscus syriacus]|uniref:Protein ASPARTIC PROTEASE IN GUARD CELL 1 n=1 Tax=Hibiscus syriacus TaxID=106335 RepID=A0A6A3BXN8_HIBSY|nr:Protein ASPARTIC PROTEASE IN GUARD CELL 1 [Hibiscus syriacus]